jgi:hypothetical protein
MAFDIAEIIREQVLEEVGGFLGRSRARISGYWQTSRIILTKGCHLVLYLLKAHKVISRASCGGEGVAVYQSGVTVVTYVNPRVKDPCLYSSH